MRPYSRFLIVATGLFALLCSLPLFAQDGDPADFPFVYVPIVNLQPPGLLVQGALMLDEQPLTDVIVQLQPCETGIAEAGPVYTSATDGNGAYVFVLPELSSNLATSYALNYDASVQTLAQSAALSTTLASFRSNCFIVDQVVGGVAALDMPTLNLAAPVFIESAEDVAQPMPVTFTWAGRSVHAPNEYYQWQAYVQFDCGGCDPVYIEADPKDVEPDPNQDQYMPTITWTCIYRHGEGSGNVLGVDYWLKVANDLGVGLTAIEHTDISSTVHCPTQ